MRNILILDTETTALEVEQGNVIEVAVILYSVKYKTVLQQISTLLKTEDNEQYKVNKISADACNEEMPIVSAMDAILEATRYADAIVAHNAEFDKKWMKTISPYFDEKKWVCSCHDFEWPDIKGAASLINIALSLEIPVFSAHRALTDCQLLAACFSKLPDLEESFKKAIQEKHIYIAAIGYDERQMAKEHGFIWNSLVKGNWAKKLNEEDAQNLPFKVSRF
jgi:DNA polymerase-3 subunit epsilon